MRRGVRPRRVTVTRYELDGRRVPKGTPGAKRIKTKSDTYYAKVGGERVSLKTTDEAEAWANLRKLLKRRADEAAGIADQYTDAASLPLSAHVDAWLADVKASGVTPMFRAHLSAHVRLLATLAPWRRLPDLTASSCLSALARVTADRDLSPRTRNEYLSHAKQFCNWCVQTGRLKGSPIASLEALPVEGDLRHSRRRPAKEEIKKLFAWLKRDKEELVTFRHEFQGGKRVSVHVGMTGPERALVYRVAMCAGLRAEEMRSLTRASFDLDAGTVAVKAAYDKRGKLAVQPLPAWLVKELAAHFEAGGAWKRLPKDQAGYVLQYDLRAAGIDYETEGPEGPLFFDFHALRHHYISTLADDPKVTPKTLQELARHHRPEYTLRVYAKARKEDVRAAADRLPRPQ